MMNLPDNVLIQFIANQQQNSTQAQDANACQGKPMVGGLSLPAGCC